MFEQAVRSSPLPGRGLSQDLGKLEAETLDMDPSPHTLPLTLDNAEFGATTMNV